MNDLLPDSYSGLLLEIKARIQRAQYEALKAVNKELIALYWDIGRMIVERQKETSWGMAVVEKLAESLEDARRYMAPLHGIQRGVNRKTCGVT